MDQAIIDLYDAYTHSRLDRRAFFERLTVLAGGTAAASAALAVLAPNALQAAVVAADDPRVEVRRASVEVMKRRVEVYRARPAGVNRPKPVVVVIHENRGLNAHIEDVARRFAVEGFLAVAPDLLTVRGGTPADPDKARELIGTLTPEDVMDGLGVVTAGLANDPDSTGKLGLVGFCWGGGVVGQAAKDPSVAAAVVYYGRVPPAETVPLIKAPLLLHYAGQDTNVNAGVPGFEAALKAAGKPYTLYMYEGAQHAFNNDTAGPRYDQAAAALAFERTLAFFRDKLA